MPKPTDNTEPRFSFFITEDDTCASHMWSRDCDADTVIEQLTKYISNYSGMLRTSPEYVDSEVVLMTIRQMAHCILWVLSFTRDQPSYSAITEFTINVARSHGKKNSLAHYTITHLAPEAIIRERLNREAKGS